jgi:hypothetical protein
MNQKILKISIFHDSRPYQSVYVLSRSGCGKSSRPRSEAFSTRGPTDRFSVPPPPKQNQAFRMLQFYNLDDGQSPKEQFYTLQCITVRKPSNFDCSRTCSTEWKS